MYSVHCNSHCTDLAWRDVLTAGVTRREVCQTVDAAHHVYVVGRTTTVDVTGGRQVRQRHLRERAVGRGRKLVTDGTDNG